MAIPVLMPKQGQSVESCFIIEWKKKEGDKVKAEEPICEVETDKAVFEVVAPEAGTMLKIFYKEGDDVPVLSTIAIIGQSEEEIEHLIPKTSVSALEDEHKEDNKIISPEESTQKIEPSFKSGQILISPVARRLAEEKGIDFTQLIGTGPDGRIVKKDIENTPLQDQQISITNKDKEYFETIKEVKVQGVRKITAERMLNSLQSTAQLTLNTSADASNLLACRKLLKSSPKTQELDNININDLLLYTVANVLPKFKNMNIHFLEDKILEFKDVHLGFAVDTPRGLMVPVIRNSNHLSLKEISKEAKRLSASCLEGKIQPCELHGGTFTVTNLGVQGIESFTPVLNVPQVAILGICNIFLKPIMKDDIVKFIPHLGLSLTFDHRAVDGAPAAKFLQELNMAIANLDLTHIKLQ